VAAPRRFLVAHAEHDRRRIAVISRIGKTVSGSHTSRVSRESRVPHCAADVVSFITASHSKKFGLRVSTNAIRLSKGVSCQVPLPFQ
jgi:hypothetical protein